MPKYSFENGRFVISDYLNASVFASFLPGVAGTDGKPLWVFYCNRGQGLTGFGTDSKDFPIVPFESAFRAYEDVRTKGFRTFVKTPRGLSQPFFAATNHTAQMTVDMDGFTISESEADYDIAVTYFTVPHQAYPGLVRRVEITSRLAGTNRFAVLDGSPRILPHGLPTSCFDGQSSLFAAYVQIVGLAAKRPFVKSKTSTSDTAMVKLSESGNGYFTLDRDGQYLTPIVDPRLVYGDDLSLIEPRAFATAAAFPRGAARTENFYPCAFSYGERDLAAGERYVFYTVFASFTSFAAFEAAAGKLSPAVFEKMREANRTLMAELTAPAAIHTSRPLFDQYARQSFLDNSLRGGFPRELAPGRIYYVFGRKHGDMERDYNDFLVPAEYYSGGNANFRDVNQNRRSDLFFFPFVGDGNIRLFFSLIQVDGQNPLNVEQPVFALPEDRKEAFRQEFFAGDRGWPSVAARLDSYRPGQLYAELAAALGADKAGRAFAEAISASTESIQASFGEGYWTDHWTYDLDLVESYLSLYPERREELLFGSGYRYFHTPISIEPRSERYVIGPSGEPRQYGSIDLAKCREQALEAGIDLKATNWLRDQHRTLVTVSFAAKTMGLILIKFAALDAFQIGIEMEGGKPGWNDALNGMPGLFGSSLCETIELLRLVRFAKKAFAESKADGFAILEEQYRLFAAIESSLGGLASGQLSRFAFWDAINDAKEQLRAATKFSCSGRFVAVGLKLAVRLLAAMEKVLVDGIKRGQELGGGLLPTYLVNEPTGYEKLGRRNHLGFETIRVTGFRQKALPAFLEAPARFLKLGPGPAALAEYRAVKASGLYDPDLGIYKTCVDLETAPFEIGRIHAFTRGWLERECDFLHMTYKFLLGLLKAGLYEEFFAECRTNLVCNMKPGVYGRSTLENSSFIVPTCNPDPTIHGKGYFARLTGANAEFVEMMTILFAGSRPFAVNGSGALEFCPAPKLPAYMFDAQNRASYTLFGHTTVVYVNPRHLDCYKGVRLTYDLDGRKMAAVVGPDALALREGKVKTVTALVSAI